MRKEFESERRAPSVGVRGFWEMVLRADQRSEKDRKPARIGG